MSALHSVSFRDWTKYRLLVEADSVSHAIELAQRQLKTGKIWDDALPCDGGLDNWGAYLLPDQDEEEGAR